MHMSRNLSYIYPFFPFSDNNSCIQKNFDIVKQPLPKKYDIILASGLFTKGHLSSAPAENISKCLNEDGILVITTPNMEDYNYMEESGWNKQQFLTEVECIGPWPSLVTTHQHYHSLRIFKAK